MALTIENGNLMAVLDPLGAQIRELWYGGILVGRDGITVGRYANRIRGGFFRLGARAWHLLINENGHCLHGGPEGFDRRRWNLEKKSSNSAAFRLISPAMDQGFPGELTVRVTYSLEDDALHIKYEAVSDAETVINLTNHSYFNLNGGGPADGHLLMINAEKYTPVTPDLIPTGELADVAGTRCDYRSMRDFEPDFDINYVLSGSGMRKAAELYGSFSGVQMDVITDQPGMQLYNTEDAICLETQHFPDSPNQPGFPDTTLRAGELFTSETIYSFTKSF